MYIVDKYWQIYLHMTTPTARVALTLSLPVDVLIKSEPAIMQIRDALYTLFIEASSPMAKIDFMWTSGPQAAFIAFISSYSSVHLCYILSPCNYCLLTLYEIILARPRSD